VGHGQVGSLLTICSLLTLTLDSRVSGEKYGWSGVQPVGVLYPGLEPGVWETATELAAGLLAQHATQPSPGYMLSNRVLPNEHFEFQGGTSRDVSWTPSRRTDPL
jgi:hypothetical protein